MSELSKARQVSTLPDIVVSVKDFGAVGDGVTDDRAAIQAAIDAASAAGGGTVLIPHTPSYYKIRLALQAKSNVTILVPNNTTRIVCTADGDGARWPIYGIICFGGYSGANYARTTAYAANAVTRSDESVTLTTAGNSANFAVGDVVVVETTSTFTVGTDVIPTWLQMNVVTASSGGVVSLRRPINQTQSSVKLRQLTTALTFLNADGTDSGYPMKAVRDFSIIGGTWENTNPVAPFMGDGGAIDCVIKPNKTVAGQGVAYGNLFAHCQLGENTAILSRNAVEIAYGSHDNVIEMGSISVNDDYSVGDPERIVGLNEGSHDNVLRIGTIDTGASSTGDVVQIMNSYRNSVEIGTITGLSITGPVVHINRLGYTGTSNDSYDNAVKVGSSNIGSQVRYVQIGTLNAYRNRVEGSFYGTVTSDAVSITSTDNVIEGYFENGALSETSDSSRNTFRGRIGTGRAYSTNYARLFSNRYDTTTTTFSSLRALSFVLDSATYTSTSGLAKTVTFPAATLTTGDVLRFTCRGRCTGASGTKVLQLAFGGTTFLDLSGGAAIASGTQGVFVDAELYVAGNTVVVGHVVYTIGSTTAQADIGITGLNLTTTGYDFVQTITVASAGDTFTARQSRLFCHRPFVENTPW